MTHVTCVSCDTCVVDIVLKSTMYLPCTYVYTFLGQLRFLVLCLFGNYMSDCFAESWLHLLSSVKLS